MFTAWDRTCKHLLIIIIYHSKDLRVNSSIKIRDPLILQLNFLWTNMRSQKQTFDCGSACCGWEAKHAQESLHPVLSPNLHAARKGRLVSRPDTHVASLSQSCALQRVMHFPGDASSVGHTLILNPGLQMCTGKQKAQEMAPPRADQETRHKV